MYIKYTDFKIVFAESGQPKEPLGREFLAQEMNMACDETTSGM